MHATCSQDTAEKFPNGLLRTSQIPAHEPPSADMGAKDLLRLSQAPRNASKVQVWPQEKEDLQYNSLAQMLADSIHGITGRHQQAQCACGQPCHPLFHEHSWCLALLRDPEEQKAAVQPVTVPGTPMGSIQRIFTSSSPLLFCATLNCKEKLQHCPTQLFIL